MSTSLAKNTHANVVPCLRYRDAPKAIDWLCRVFGFEKRMATPEENGIVHHAELVFGHGMVMVASVYESPFGQYLKQPDEIGGAETQSVYLIVSDADAVHTAAKAAGAE